MPVHSMSYRAYLIQLCIHVLSSYIVLGVIIGAAVLVAGEGSLNLNMDLDFGAFDGISVIFGLPLIAVLLSVVLSPLSFWIHKLLAKRETYDRTPDA